MGQDLIPREKVLEILNRLLEQAEICEVESGETPTAQEALSWAISEVGELQSLSRE